MAFITIPEILDVIVMSALIGYIFYPYFSRFNVFRRHTQAEYYAPIRRKFNWSDFMFSIYLIAPAIILHEIGHKAIAVGFGYDATFNSAISLTNLVSLTPQLGFVGALFNTLSSFPAILMIIAVVVTFFGGTFLFFIPAYVTFSAMATPLQVTFIAFAGPFVNLILWLVPAWMIKKGKIQHKYMPFVVLTSKINMLLFIFNMIPFPGFDGFQFFRGIIQTIF